MREAIKVAPGQNFTLYNRDWLTDQNINLFLNQGHAPTILAGTGREMGFVASELQRDLRVLSHFNVLEALQEINRDLFGGQASTAYSFDANHSGFVLLTGQQQIPEVFIGIAKEPIKFNNAENANLGLYIGQTTDTKNKRGGKYQNFRDGLTNPSKRISIDSPQAIGDFTLALTNTSKDISATMQGGNSRRQLPHPDVRQIAQKSVDVIQKVADATTRGVDSATRRGKDIVKQVDDLRNRTNATYVKAKALADSAIDSFLDLFDNGVNSTPNAQPQINVPPAPVLAPVPPVAPPVQPQPQPQPQSIYHASPSRLSPLDKLGPQIDPALGNYAAHLAKQQQDAEHMRGYLQRQIGPYGLVGNDAMAIRRYQEDMSSLFSGGIMDPFDLRTERYLNPFGDMFGNFPSTSNIPKFGAGSGYSGFSPGPITGSWGA